MTLARVRRPTCEARSAARKASPITYTPPWKYRTTWRGSIPSTVISAVGTPPSAAAVTVTSAGRGCASIASRSSRRCSSTSLSIGNADWRRIASIICRWSLLTGISLRLGWSALLEDARPCHSAAEISCREAGDGSGNLAQADARCLHRLAGREETDLGADHLRSELRARLTQEFAGDPSRRKNCLPQLAQVRS